MAEPHKFRVLSKGAVAVLDQLWQKGPTWDGNVIGKNARGELVRAGYAFHIVGYASLTPSGVELAASTLKGKD